EGEVGDDLDAIGRLVVGEVLAAPGLQLVGGGRVGGIGGRDEGDADLADHGRGYSDHRDALDARMQREHVLHFERVHVVAAADVHLGDAPAQLEVAVVAETTEVAGEDPSVVGQR